ncbi:hypothetical protein B296_00022057 [Ensete ventricosum]|uniref:Uncharacterized protein n=1 Tax=Ensete ventricosum TaxID=4639 RepID=A0A426Z0X5_ENSVE|nr:hypothetical protein B296_00022057 [Ensete ventricosum]
MSRVDYPPAIDGRSTDEEGRHTFRGWGYSGKSLVSLRTDDRPPAPWRPSPRTTLRQTLVVGDDDGDDLGVLDGCVEAAVRVHSDSTDRRRRSVRGQGGRRRRHLASFGAGRWRSEEIRESLEEHEEACACCS